MKTRTVTRQEVDADPYCIWNAYVDLLAMEGYEDLSPEQRPAHLVFWYEHEVQNGGHFQYFENRGTDQLAATIEGLGTVGATGQQQVLREAGEQWLSHARDRVESVEDFCDEALEDEFGEFDSRFNDCSPSLPKCLESHLEQHRSTFVTVT